MAETTEQIGPAPATVGVHTSAPQFKLARATLNALPATVKGPDYHPSSLTAGIGHIGTGNFFLAHMASYAHELVAKDPRWGILATSIRSRDKVSALKQQDGLFVLVVRKNAERSAHVLAPIVETLLPGNHEQHFVVSFADRFADPRLKVWTITVSNKGYCLSHGKLDSADDGVAHDLAHPESPRTLYGFVAAALAARKLVGMPVTIMSLDNIERNSWCFKQALLQFLELRGEHELAAWVVQNADFPVTLVDRITPETTDEFRRQVREDIGFDSSVVVGTESFRQLVVERSRFETPDWESVGVKVVDDCSEWWQKKFYCVNAGHQVVAIPGQRLGDTYVHDVLKRPAIVRLLERAHAEWAIALPGDKAELAEFTASVRERFADEAARDTVARVAARTTSKVSERLLSSVEFAMLSSRSLPKVPIFVTAVWLLNLGRTDECGKHITLHDADAEKLQMVHAEVRDLLAADDKKADLPAMKTRLCTVMGMISGALFDPRFSRLSREKDFIRELAWSLRLIHRLGVEKAIDSLLSSPRRRLPPAGRRRATVPVCLGDTMPAKKIKRKLKALLFDCDGTLVLSEALAFAACCELVNEILAKRGVKRRFTPAELMREFVGQMFRHMITKLSQTHGFELSAHELDKLVVEEENRVIAKLSAEVEACEGINEVLSQVHGKYTLAVVSSSAKRRILACLQKVGQDIWLVSDRVYSASTSLPTPKSKPDPAVYNHALEQLGITADEAVAIEDSRSGVKSAVAAGIVVIGYVGSYPADERDEMTKALKDAGASVVISDYSKWSEALDSVQEAEREAV